MDRFNEHLGRFFREADLRAFTLVGVGMLAAFALFILATTPPSFWLQIRINLAAPGTTIRLRPRDYKGSVEVEKPLVLVGRDPARPCRLGIRAHGDDDVEVAVRDLTLVGYDSAGIYCAGTALVRLERVEIRECGVALFVTNQARVEALDCTFLDCWAGTSVLIDGKLEAVNCSWKSNEHSGIRSNLRASIYLRNCQISSNGGLNGLATRHNAQTRTGYVPLTNVLSRERGVGISAMGKATVQLESCAISSNGDHGIVALHETSVSLRDCDIAGNRSTGLLLLSSADHELADCTVRENGEYGMLMASSGSVHLSDSTVAGNCLGELATYDTSCFGSRIESDDSLYFAGNVSGTGNSIGEGKSTSTCCPTTLCSRLTAPD